MNDWQLKFAHMKTIASLFKKELEGVMGKNDNHPFDDYVEEQNRIYPDTPQYKPGARRCLRCGKFFRSKWIGNRLCQSCKQSNEGVGDV